MSTIGEISLSALLKTLTTVVHPSTFVFVTLPAPATLPPTLNIQMQFQESEGTTIITTEESAAEHGLESTFPSRMITLNVHSSLEAVGFMAVVATRLAQKGVTCNPVSGYFHDHVFVPVGKLEDALAVMVDIAQDAKAEQ